MSTHASAAPVCGQLSPQYRDSVEKPLGLIRYPCRCGWVSSVWFADAGRANRAWERHVAKHDANP